jgi:hypothetical protein
MTIPIEFNGSLFLWFNQVVGDLNVYNSDLAVFTKYWASLPIAVKSAIKTKTINDINSQITELQNIVTEINALS